MADRDGLREAYAQRAEAQPDDMLIPGKLVWDLRFALKSAYKVQRGATIDTLPLPAEVRPEDDQ